MSGAGLAPGGVALALGVAFGCTPAAPAAPAASVAAQPVSAAVAFPQASAQPPAPTSEVAPAASGPVAAELKLEVSQVSSVPVSSIALGEGTRVAVLSDPPQVGDERGLQALPLPAALRAKAGEADDARIYFGRDNEPRIMGTRRSVTGEAAIYWRHTAAAGWRDGREELGQLGAPAHAGLWGVLGAADPELVCRAGAQCIIKRASGWKSAPAGAAPRNVVLQDGVLWGLDASGISSIDGHGWALAIAAPPWREPRAFWATQGEAWVSAEQAIFRFHEGAWRSWPVPFPEVTSWWGQTADEVWLVGKGGIAHFDGQGFRARSVPGQLRVIVGRADGTLWFGGDAGLFRAVVAKIERD